MRYIVDKTRKNNNYGKNRNTLRRGNYKNVNRSYTRRINHKIDNEKEPMSSQEMVVMQCIVASVLFIGVLLCRYIEIDEVQLARSKAKEYITANDMPEEFLADIKGIYSASKEKLENTINDDSNYENSYEETNEINEFVNINKNTNDFRIDQYILDDMNSKN